MHTDDFIESDYSPIEAEPLDIYSRQEFYDEEIQNTVYGTDEEFNTLLYDIEKELDTEFSKSVISTFVCTQQNTQSVCLAQVNGKVKRMWVKALFKSELKVCSVCS